MTPEATFVLVGMLSAAFGLVYFPLFDRLARGVVSPYPKVEMARRAAAAMIDGALVVICLIGFRMQGSPLFFLLGGVYLLLRDALFVPGQSVGKFLLGLVVIDLRNGRPCTRAGSVKRNFILLVPGLNVVALGLEALAVIRDRQGQRLGDRLANTQVIDGLGAKEFVRIVQRAMLEIELKQGGKEQPVPVDLQIGARFSNVEGCAEISRPWPISRRPPPPMRFARRRCSSFAS
jgi:hypothetical protein